jgi:hypothetical protein
MESKACVIDLALLPTLEGLLLETYASLQPKPVDYENRQVMINVFNKIAEQIFGKKSFVSNLGIKDLYSCNVLLRSLLMIVRDVYCTCKIV